MSIERRTFLKAIGVLGVGSLSGCNQAPTDKLHAYLTPPEDVIPGVAGFYATICRACPAGCGLWVKTREARPIKLEGNPRHPVSRGALCPRGQAFIQSLYGRHRIAEPLMRVQDRLQPVPWAEAVDALAGRLAKASSVTFLSGAESGSFETVRGDFLSRFPRSRALEYEPLGMTSQAAAASLLFGRSEVPWLDLRRTHYVLSLGADLLDAWISPVHLAAEWAERHSIQNQRALRLDYAGPRRNLTATAADRWIPLPPARMGALALALAHELFLRRRDSLAPEQADLLGKALARLGPRPAAPPLEEGLWKSVLGPLTEKPGAVILYGGAECRTAEATAVHAAVLLLNLLTGAIGSSLLFDAGYVYSKLHSEKKVADAIDAAAQGATDVLLVHGCNPAGTLPASLEIPSRLGKAATVVAMAYEHSETTAAADFVLPVHHPLESWGDYDVTRTICGLMQPVRAPLYKTRMAGDLLIELSRKTGKPLAHPDYKSYVTARWAAMAASQNSQEWEKMLIDGGRFAAPAPPSRPVELIDGGLDRLPAISLETASGAGCTLLAPMTALRFDGRSRTQDWLWEVPDPVLQTAWDLPVEIAADLARQHGIADGDLVSLKGRSGAVTGLAVVCPDLCAGTAALPFGGGSAPGPEENPNPDVLRLLPPVFDPLSGELALVATGIEAAKAGTGTLARTQASSYSDDRYLCLAMDLADAQAGRYPRMVRHGEIPASEAAADHGAAVPMPADDLNQRHPHDAVHELPDHPEHRWGMTVDLDRCTGCGACIVACYAENNVPVVGREEIIRRRDLAWLRIEKHIVRHGRGQQVRWLPVMCQHCTNAPCEIVCPAFATQHTPEGLNSQIYNRCVGTRYCANNCPYKVRRFNFFDYAREVPANEQLNPDVTVRPRGVMEKCSLCIQRIREVTNRAKAESRPVREGEILPACVQTCPTGALTFGDFRQESWRATRLAADPRGYRLLDYVVNTRPGIVYLRKVNTYPAPPGA